MQKYNIIKVIDDKIAELNKFDDIKLDYSYYDVFKFCI